jgi:hypothetical protein
MHFVSQAVIQHFPSRAYYENFAARINSCSTLRAVMLQPRVGPKSSERNAYRAQTRSARQQVGDVAFALVLGKNDVPASVPAFTLVVRTMRKAVGYVFYILVRTPQSRPYCAFT